MAVFLINNCQFQGCGLRFTTLTELIQHIEDTHLETDVKTLEKQEMHPPASVPLSQILRISADAAKRAQAELIRKRARAQSPASSPASNTDINRTKNTLLLNVESSNVQLCSNATYARSNSATGSEFDEDEMVSENEDSDDSWTNQEEFNSDLILSMRNTKEADGDKPFPCPIPGCKKRYKNINGIKYHARHGHRKDARVRKGYRCHCGKSYKTSQGLRNHSQHCSTFDILSLSQQQSQQQQNCAPHIQQQQQQPPPSSQQQHVRPTQLAVAPSSKPSIAQLTCHSGATASVNTPPITPTNLSAVNPSLAAAFSQSGITQTQLMAQLPSSSSVAHMQLLSQPTTALVTTATAYEQ